MSELDLQQVLRDIEDEVKARRAAGDFPPGLERELDLTFARFSPPAASTNDLDGLLVATERNAFLDADPPTGSRIPAVSILKRLERKLFGWYFRYVTQQVTSFAGSIVAVLRLLTARLEKLEAASSGADREVVRSAQRSARRASLAGLAAAVVDHVAEGGGRILIAEANDTTLVEPLRARGADVYAVADVEVGVETRVDEPLDHLNGVAEGALAGLVLAGVVDRAPLASKLALLDRARIVLARPGRVAVVGTDPASWAKVDPVLADLALGHPLHAETWVHLLGERGFTDSRVLRDGDAYAVLALA